MQLVVLGLNHKTAPVGVRECFSLSDDKVKAGLRHIDEYEQIHEAVIISTCNRSEVYVVVDDAEEALPALKQFLYDLASSDEDAEDYMFHYYDEACITHLFKVAASLDSLIIGEGQILSQVKKGYWIAKEAGTTSTVLNTLFHRAIAVGKRVRTETRIAYSAVSVSYAAVELAKNLFGDLSNSNVLLLGAGQMGELTARHLADQGVQTVFVSNRRYERAVDLAKKFNGQAVQTEHAMNCAVNVDIVITSTGAPHYIVKAWETQQLMTKRKGKPIIFIDIAVPRDVEPEVANIKGVRLYNIDDLEAVVDSNIKVREQEAALAGKIVAEEVEELVNKFRYLSFRPVMALLTDKAERIRQREVKRAMAKLSDITPEERKIMENMSRMIVRKLLREPMVKINSAAGTGNEEYYIKAMRDLFKLDTIGEKRKIEKKTSYRYARQ
ncbi:glutamyl-tRNA reductase [Anaerosinus massiliensis]|uniref:glutamyl-tRNA reductase n=1 Tax=Massilibacillus massiliensis TaxID=1806837 RepID=UPI000AEE519A|nr:glutamyl-tRNA reductase [Massilibacillus massiliensis]